MRGLRVPPASWRTRCWPKWVPLADRPGLVCVCEGAGAKSQGTQMADEIQCSFVQRLKLASTRGRRLTDELGWQAGRVVSGPSFIADARGSARWPVSSVSV